jgi:hypothetical protein
MNKKLVLALMGMTAAIGVASAADIDVIADIATSTSWTSNNVYHLRDVINVNAGATLSIQAGTRVVGYTDVELAAWASEVRDDSSALVIQVGGKIMAEGTKDAPIVFTSSHDDGTWRPSNSEWGNLTMLGDAIIAEGNFTSGVQDGTCYDNMEGLTVSALSQYGGTNDDDDSGALRYVSLRYGGSVIGTANELNGLSLGGIGRETVFDHIEIMNNVDDGIEIWGGAPQLKYVSIWNIGDDSFDLDEGFRGKAQFGLIVQGYGDGTQGSGVGDNCFEMDGAEHPDNMQPYANPQVYNFTVIGQPVGGDKGMAFRDNMRIQIGNSIFMDIGESLVSFETSFNDLMFDAFTELAHDTYVTNGVNFAGLPYSTMAEFYSSSRSGNWSWIKDSVFYNIAEINNIGYDDDGDTINETTTDLGLWDSAMNNTQASSLPIAAITRDTSAGQPLSMQLVIGLDPRAANDAVTSVETAPNDGFFSPVPFRGAFSPDNNWLEGWTAADEYGFLLNTGSNPADPSSSIEMTASTFFQTTADVVYTVEESSDMKNWTPVASVVGDGSVMSATDLDAFDSAKFYRAIAQ